MKKTRETRNRNIEKTIKILMQLDKKSLLLIESGAKLLAARQEMEEHEKQDLQQVNI